MGEGKKIQPRLTTAAGFEVFAHECIEDFHRCGPEVLQAGAQLHFDAQASEHLLVRVGGCA